MIVQTKHFGEIDLDESKVVTFDNGIMGFEDCKRYTILYNSESEERPIVSWLQSLDEPGLALPIVSPEYVKPDYSPMVEDELLKGLNNGKEEDLVILLTLTVPVDLTKMTVNLKAPIIIDVETRKGCQLIAENPDYVVKYGVYDLLCKKGE